MREVLLFKDLQWKTFVLFLSGLCMLTFVASTLRAETITVNSTADGPVGVCDASECTLREAIVRANNLAGPDIVVVPAGSYVITHLGTDDGAMVGDLDIIGDLLIVGEDWPTTTVSGSSQDRIFDIRPGATVVIRRLSVMLGYSAQGGGIRNGGDLTLDETFVGLNESTQHGGGIYSEGPLRIERSAIFSNEASGWGAGIYAYEGPLVIVECTISSNTAGQEGGGIDASFSGSEILIERSLITNNEVLGGLGGGAIKVFTGSPYEPIAVTVRNTTVTGNTTPGGVDADIVFINPVQVNFIHATLATTGPELIFAGVGTEYVKFSNSIVQGLCTGGSLAYVSEGGNVESTGDSCGFGAADLTNVSAGDLGLLSMMNNGGPTSTRGLGTGSVALGFGIPSSCEAQDQRTLMRDDGACDAGAFEAGATTSALIFADGFEDGDTLGW